MNVETHKPVDVTEVKLHTVKSWTVWPEDGSPAFRLYEIEGFAPMRWPAFKALLDAQAEDIRDADEARRRPADIQ